jgi:hypothetical protein
MVEWGGVEVEERDVGLGWDGGPHPKSRNHPNPTIPKHQNPIIPKSTNPINPRALAIPESENPKSQAYKKPPICLASWVVGVWWSGVITKWLC